MLAFRLAALRPSTAAKPRLGDAIRAVVDRTPRTNVSYRARCEIGLAVFLGEICDASDGGVFFRYEHGYVDGELRYGGELMGELALGDKVQIVVDDPRAQAGAFAAEVRWSGVGRHGPGFGARRTSAELETAGGSLAGGQLHYRSGEAVVGRNPCWASVRDAGGRGGRARGTGHGAAWPRSALSAFPRSAIRASLRSPRTSLRPPPRGLLRGC